LEKIESSGDIISKGVTSENAAYGNKVLTQWLIPSIHPAYARLFCAHLKNEGVDLDIIFKGSCLSWKELMTQKGFISFEQFQRLISNAINYTQCPWLGLKISTMIQVSAHGPLGYGALAAQTVRDSFKLVEKSLGTRLSIYHFNLIEKDSRALFQLKEMFDPGEAREFIFTTLLGSFLDLLEKTSGHIGEGVLVLFPYDEPEWSDLYAKRFANIQLVFGRDRFEIDMPSSMLDAYCLTADEFAYRNAVRECDALLDQKNQGGDLSSRIKVELFKAQAPYPSQAQIAQHFNMSSRTLIRKLKLEGSSYQSLLDEVRKELACWYLQNSAKSIEQIADIIGFQDTSNFSRVFRRWLDCKPSEFRGQAG